MCVKTCLICKIEKPLDKFRSRERNNKIYYESYCRLCEQQYNKRKCNEYYHLNKAERKKYRIENRDRLLGLRKQRRDKEQVYQNEYNKQRRATDPAYKMRKYIANDIRNMLRKSGASKNGKSCLVALGYSIEELKTHIESQFEFWMTWHNRGEYKASTWDDNDPNTWTWQLDHIIPQSLLPYTSIKDDNFKKCWALNNLRPLSAKQNIFDGINRIRHK